MRTRAKLQPGQRGTKRWVKQYGDRLVCVRYRYDAERRRRYTTVELIVDEGEWDPPPDPSAIVGIRVNWGERELARAVRKAGGLWNRQKRLWELRYDQAAALGLLDRLVALDV